MHVVVCGVSDQWRILTGLHGRCSSSSETTIWAFSWLVSCFSSSTSTSSFDLLFSHHFYFLCNFQCCCNVSALGCILHLNENMQGGQRWRCAVDCCTFVSKPSTCRSPHRNHCLEAAAVVFVFPTVFLRLELASETTSPRRYCTCISNTQLNCLLWLQSLILFQFFFKYIPFIYAHLHMLQLFLGIFLIDEM